MSEPKEAPKFSRHVNDQYRWREQILSRVRDALHMAELCRMTQEAYLRSRDRIYTESKIERLTRDSRAYVDGYLRAMWEIQSRKLICVRRIAGRPETASGAKWDAMTEELREACRNGETETCLAWDSEGKFPYGPWTADHAGKKGG